MTKSHEKNRRYFYRPLIVTTLAVGGFLQLVTPLLASGTAARTQISNTATATYTDPSAPNVQINTTSNTVVVTVAEVAGITVIPKAVINNTAPGSQVLPNHQLYYDYEVTNVGNDATQFFIPTTVTITGAGVRTVGTEIMVSQNGGAFANLSTLTNQLTGAINPGGSVTVRVPITVNSNAPSGAAISVLLGNTGANDNSAGTQNQLDSSDSANNDEVRTVDSIPGNGTRVDGEKEASALQQVLVGAQPKAFAAILKSRTNYVANTAPLTDDLLTYGLTLRVDNAAPSGSPGFVAAGLVGTTVPGIGNNRVLVSDVIPAGTVLQDSNGNGTGTPVITAPSGWQVVYSSTPINTSTDTANSATWTTTAPSSAAGYNAITRIGFVYDASTTPIAAGTTVTGFSLTVRTAKYPLTASQTSIENIAQVFGETNGVTPGAGTLIHDESGDQNPSNFNDDGTPNPAAPTNGVANSSTQGADPNSSDNDPTNDNRGVGPGGEVNVFVLLPPGAVLNGPQGQPNAIGPNDSNDDFTNKAVSGNQTPARGSTLSAPVTTTFVNTVQNPNTSALTNVLLVPRDISQVPALYGISRSDLPNNTTVRVIYGSDNATYSYNSTTGAFTFTGGTGPGPVRINNLPAGTSVNYTVEVILPAGTHLSTDEETPGTLYGGYPVPVVAFSDTGTVNGLPDTGESQNLTINRTYLGYLSLAKSVQAFDANGASVNLNSIVPGNVLAYQITYRNISEASVGSGNVTLNANNVNIIENGTTNGNNWALDNDNADSDGNASTGIDTSNVQGTATATQGSITFNPSGDRSGLDQSTDVTIYTNNVGAVAPQSTGTFTFRRRVN